MLQDRRAIENLISRVAELLDLGDVDGYGEIFARARYRTDRNPDGYVRAEGVRDMVRKFVLMYGGRPCTKHVVTNVAVELHDDGTASASSVFTVYQSRPELPLQVVIAGRYRDRFERDDVGWYFVDRRITADAIGDLRYHVPLLIPPGR